MRGANDFLKTCFIVVACLAWIPAAYAQNAPSGQVGPTYCAECRIGVPIPDQGTRDLLEELGVVLIGTLNATSFQVCNDTHCANYQRSNDGIWFGTNRQERVGSSGPFVWTGSGPGSSPNPGGWQPPGFNVGCLSMYDNC
jgi:hypothetical protein